MSLAPRFDLTFLMRTGAPPLQELQIGGTSRSPKPGSALHHLVTSVGVKKALTVRGGNDAVLDSSASGRGAGSHPRAALVR
jgi:hypothetical protein